MHALNNYLLAPFVQQQDCRSAAHQVVQRLTEANAGDVEPMSNHLDPETGWLSIDVINVVCQANLGCHVQAARVIWPVLRHQQDGAALVNWNNRHWTVLQQDPEGVGWMHTNSIEGEAPRHGRRRRLSDEAVEEVLEDIRLDARGDVALHVITRDAGAEGRRYLESEGLRAMAPAEIEEASGHAAAGVQAESDDLRLVTLNVDGVGSGYADLPQVRMDAILTAVLLVDPPPDVLVLQEVTSDMLAQIRSRLPTWKICRRSGADEDYFNVTAMRHGTSEPHRSCLFDTSRDGRHYIKVQWNRWTIWNTHAESGSLQEQRDARERQLCEMSRKHENEPEHDLFVFAGDLNLRDGEDSDLLREGWRDAWSLQPGDGNWTWGRGLSKARYDRIFLHDAKNGDSAECVEIRRLTGVHPALIDHLPLHAVVRRKSQVRDVPEEASSPAIRQAALGSSSSSSGPAAAPSSATRQAATAPSSSATGPAASPSSATGQAARTQRQSGSAHDAGTVSVVAIGNAIVLRAKAVRDAGLLRVEDAGGAGELPKWNEVPKECGFKIARRGGRGQQQAVTKEEKTAQCLEYGRTRTGRSKRAVWRKTRLSSI